MVLLFREEKQIQLKVEGDKKDFFPPLIGFTLPDRTARWDGLVFNWIKHIFGPGWRPSASTEPMMCFF